MLILKSLFSNRMKTFACISYIITCIVCIHCLTLPEAQQHVQECLDEFKITKEELATMRREKSPEIDCFSACIMKKRGSITDGKINEEAMLNILKQLNVLTNDRNEDKFTKCATAANTQSNECLVARDMIGCFFYESLR